MLLILFFFFTPILTQNFFLVFSGACLAVPEATRKNTCYSQKILLTWNVRSAKVNVPHRSTQQLSRRLILAPTHRLIPNLHRRPIYLVRHRSILHRLHRSILHRLHRSILSRRTWLRLLFSDRMKMETCMTRMVICVMQHVRN